MSSLVQTSVPPLRLVNPTWRERAEAFLVRRRLGSGLCSLQRVEKEQRGRVLREVRRICTQMENNDPAGWAREIVGDTEAGGGGWASIEEVFLWQLFEKHPGRWWVALSGDGWHLLMKYARLLAEQSGEGEWASAPAWVAQLIANRAAPQLVTDFRAIVARAHRFDRHQASRRGRAYEVFIEGQLGSEMNALLESCKPSLSPGDIVNVFLRDRAFMAKLVKEVTAS